MLLPFRPVFLPTDILLLSLVGLAVWFALWSRRQPHRRAPWAALARNAIGVSAGVVFLTFVSLGVLDSLHGQRYVTLTAQDGAGHPVKQRQAETQVRSALDWLLGTLAESNEISYSAPLATHLYSKMTVRTVDGHTQRLYPQLQHSQPLHTLGPQLVKGLAWGSLCWLLGVGLCAIGTRPRGSATHRRLDQQIFHLLAGRTDAAWAAALWTAALIALLLGATLALAPHVHLLGTDKVGQDVLYMSLKSIRTGLVIGTVTTLALLPIALTLGISAGYFGGWIDDVIQYLYTTLSAIPGVLLISAAVLSLQLHMSRHAADYASASHRADAHLLALCLILGVTGWTPLCRLLRAETLKLKTLDFVLAARTLGVSQATILIRHILPNVMHLVLITVVLDFSGLVLAEAVLSYVGVGVDPSTLSWGNMINSARLELARDPIVWWPLLAAFVFMLALVLSANLLADAVQAALNPKAENSE